MAQRTARPRAWTARSAGWFLTAAVLAAAAVGIAGLAMWADLGAHSVPNPAAAAALTRGAAAVSLGCAVLALPFAVRPGSFGWVLPVLFGIGCVTLVVGWRAAGTGSAWGAAGLTVAVVCGIAAVVSVLATPARR